MVYKENYKILLKVIKQNMKNWKVYNKQSQQINNIFGKRFCTAKFGQRVSRGNRQRAYKLIGRNKQPDRKMGELCESSHKAEIHRSEKWKDQKIYEICFHICAIYVQKYMCKRNSEDHANA